MKFPLLLSAALALLVQLSTAEDIRRITLDGSAAGPAPAQETNSGGVTIVKKIDQAALELFPTTKKPSRGTMLIAPGGGYGILAVDHEGRDVARMLNDAGWDAAVLFYHVNTGPTTRELAIADAKGAYDLLTTRGAEFGLSTKVGIMGFSAGGHLAARLAHEVAATKPPAVVLIYPAYLQKDDKVLDDVAPIDAPTFLYVAADDGLVVSSDAYAKACEQMKVPVEFHKPTSGGHGFGLTPKLPEAVRDWPEKLKAFLAKVP